jgi:GT2 family glycosyltransferase
LSERDIHAVVVAYGGADPLRVCLGVLERAVAVTVVDNSSSGEVRAVALAQGAAYVDAGKNLGFAAGVNVGLRSLLNGRPCDILLLNPDAILSREQLELLAAHLHLPGNERLAAVSPRLVDMDGRTQRVLWPFPSPVRAWLDALGVGSLGSRSAFVIGAVLLLRWEAVQEVGMFDERFFLYAEETDWQRRAVDRGWHSRVCTDSVAQHAGAGASDDPRRREALFHAAQEIYVRKWHGRLGWLFYRLAVLAGAVVRATVLRGDRRAEACRRAVLYLRGPARCAALARR